MVRMFLLVCVTILGPSLLMLLVFYRTIPARMESQAKGNVNFYISQVTASVANTMELAQDIAYNAMIDDSLCASMQDLDMYLALQGRDGPASGRGGSGGLPIHLETGSGKQRVPFSQGWGVHLLLPQGVL